MQNLLPHMEIFYHVANLQSFSRAAEKLKVSKGHISQQINSLERELGVTLLQRTTRSLKLTEAGETFLQSCTRVINEKNLALSLVEELQTEPSGNLKISAPPSMCSTILTKIIPKFLDKYPKITLTVDASSTQLDLIKNDIDLALRITNNPQPNYVARLISSFKFSICASPKYLQQHGTPKSPQDLTQHNCLIYSADPISNTWPFTKKQKFEEITVHGNLRATNSNIIKEAVLAGKGIARLPDYLLQDEIKNKKIKLLLETYNEAIMPIYAMYASSRSTAPKIKAFLEFLSSGF